METNNHEIWQSEVVQETIRGLRRFLGYQDDAPMTVTNRLFKKLEELDSLEPLDTAALLAWDIYKESAPDEVIGEVPIQVLPVLVQLAALERDQGAFTEIRKAIMSPNPCILKLATVSLCEEYAIRRRTSDDEEIRILLGLYVRLCNMKAWEFLPPRLIACFADTAEGVGETMRVDELKNCAQDLRNTLNKHMQKQEEIANHKAVESRLEKLKTYAGAGFKLKLN